VFGDVPIMVTTTRCATISVSKTSLPSLVTVWCATCC